MAAIFQYDRHGLLLNTYQKSVKKDKLAINHIIWSCRMEIWCDKLYKNVQINGLV